MHRQLSNRTSVRAIAARIESPVRSHVFWSGLISAAAAAYIALSGGVAFGQETAVLPSMSGFVYTADEYGNSMSAINLTDGHVQTLPVAISPHNIQISADGRRLFAVGNPAAMEGHDQAQTGQETEMEGMKGLLLVFDPDKLASGPLASIEVGEHPAHVVVDRTGSRAFVTLAEENAVAVVDLARQKVSQTIPTGAYPHGLRLTPDGSVAYVANVEDGSVSVLDTEKLTEVARIPVGRAPVQVGFTPDGGQVFVSLRDENKVAVVDTATRKVLGKVEVGRGPIQVFVTPDGRFVYVANQGSKDDPADTVSVISVATRSVVETIRTGAGAHGVVVSTDGRTVFVTNIAAGTVSMVDVESQSVVKEFVVGKGPNGVTFRPSGS
ncbi:cytochrome D1 domain-containing protein [Dongia sp.]|uniref:YVTN family beta-propeller repeat protein n=1 Tax=Dongia sp. TaxID=1977262 RepID=UPI0037513B8C